MRHKPRQVYDRKSYNDNPQLATADAAIWGTLGCIAWQRSTMTLGQRAAVERRARLYILDV